MLKSTFWPTVDSDAVDRFESARLAGEPVDLAAFLPPTDDVCFHATLEELVLIDLEASWRAPAVEDAPRPRVEDYTARFPTLAQPAVLSRLAHEEFLVRHRFGDAPDAEAFVARFGKTLVSAASLGRAVAEGAPPGDAAGSAAPRAGERRGRYVLEREYARGGMGAVWVARDPTLGREIAVKQLTAEVAGHGTATRRFVGEARVAAQLEHPGIVPVYDAGELADGQPWFSMKLVRGQTLSEAIAAFHARPRDDPERRVEQRRLLDHVVALTRAVAFAHAHGVVHRDLKPGNVLLGEYGETVLLDWGLARAVGETAAADAARADGDGTEARLTRYGAVLGTPAFMSPEHASGDPDAIDEASDQYALGAILYLLLAGRLPVEADSAEAIMARLRAPTFEAARIGDRAVPRALEAICLKALAREPAQRYASVEAMTADLVRWAADEPVRAFREPWRSALGRWARRHRAWVAAGVVAVVLSAVGLVLAGLAAEREAAREARRTAELVTASETARDAAQSELRWGRAEAAAAILRPAAARLADEADFAEAHEALAGLLADAERLTRFEATRELADERLFLGDLSGAWAAGTQALEAIGALSEGRGDWWSVLPVGALAPAHRDRVRHGVQALLVTLAEVAATAPAEAPVTPSGCADAVALARRAAAFRPARALARVAGTCRDDAAAVGWTPRAVTRPRSATDHLLESRATLGLDPLSERLVPDPDVCEGFARAVALEPDAYWPLLWLARCHERAGRLDAALRDYDHAVAVRPDGWLGHALRAAPLLYAAGAADDPSARGELVRLGLRSLRRALDLAPYRAEAHWLAARSQQLTGTLAVATAHSAIRALELEPPTPLGPAARDRRQTQWAWAEALTTSPAEAGLTALRATLRARLHLARGDAAGALREAEAALAAEADQPLAGAARAEALAALGRWPEALSAFEANHAARPESWRAAFGVASALTQLRPDTPEAAAAWELARAAATTAWQEAATEAAAPDGVPTVDATRQATQVPRGLGPILRPPLLGGDFEVGLASAWGLGQYESARPVWWNSRSCASVAYVTRQERYAGEGALYVHNPSNQAPHVYGTTSQDVPITPGVSYRVSAWIKARAMTHHALWLIVDRGWHERPFVAPEGTYGWRRIEGEFTLDADVAHVRILIQGPGTAWLDELVIERVAAPE